MPHKCRHFGILFPSPCEALSPGPPWLRRATCNNHEAEAPPLRSCDMGQVTVQSTRTRSIRLSQSCLIVLSKATGPHRPLLYTFLLILRQHERVSCIRSCTATSVASIRKPGARRGPINTLQVALSSASKALISFGAQLTRYRSLTNNVDEHAYAHAHAQHGYWIVHELHHVYAPQHPQD